MLKFSCKDTGADCDFVATGETVEDIKKAAFAHAEMVHKDLLQSMTPEQLQELEKTMETYIQKA